MDETQLQTLNITLNTEEAQIGTVSKEMPLLQTSEDNNVDIPEREHPSQTPLQNAEETTPVQTALQNAEETNPPVPEHNADSHTVLQNVEDTNADVSAM